MSTFDDWKSADPRHNNPFDIDAPPEPGVWLEHGDAIWCACGTLLIGDVARAYATCDFCANDRMVEARENYTLNATALQDQIELEGHGWGRLAEQTSLPF